jgi:hypothetical protein
MLQRIIIYMDITAETKLIHWPRVIIGAIVLFILLCISFYAGHKFPVLFGSGATPTSIEITDSTTASVTPTK